MHQDALAVVGQLPLPCHQVTHNLMLRETYPIPDQYGMDTGTRECMQTGRQEYKVFNAKGQQVVDGKRYFTSILDEPLGSC